MSNNKKNFKKKYDNDFWYKIIIVNNKLFINF